MSPDEVKAARIGLRLSQAELARALGVHALTVSKWETGYQAPPAFLRLALNYLAVRAMDQPDRDASRSVGLEHVPV